MKIIDLLNKIANYDEPIMKIKYQDTEYKFDGNTYRDNEGEGMSITVMIHSDLSNLNDEVEILEEKEMPEKLDYIYPDIQCSYNESELLLRIEANKDKINSIIDYLKSKGAMNK